MKKSSQAQILRRKYILQERIKSGICKARINVNAGEYAGIALQEILTMAQRSTHEMDILNGPIVKKYIIYVIPLALGYILQLMFNAADVIVVGQFAGTTALAAVGANTAMVALYLNIYSGLATGVNILTAKYYATGNVRSTERIVHTSMGLSFVLGILFLVAGVLTARPLLELIGTPDDIIDMAELYLIIYCASLPAAVVYNFAAAILRSIGDTKRPTYYLIIAGVVNVIINLVSVIIFKMGVAGVAMGTAISSYVSAIMIVITLTKEESSIKLNLRRMNIEPAICKDILQFGIPLAVQNSLFSIPNLMIQSSVNSFGSLYVAGNSASQSIESFQMAFLSANGIGAATFTSQHVGAGKYKRAHEVMRTILMISTVMSLTIGLSFVLLRHPLIGLYNSNEEVIAVASRRLIIMVMTDFLDAAMCILSNVIRGYGKSVPPMIITLIFVCGFRMIWIYGLFPIFNFYEFVILAWPVSWILAVPVLYLYYLKIRKAYPDTDGVPVHGL